MDLIFSIAGICSFQTVGKILVGAGVHLIREIALALKCPIVSRKPFAYELTPHQVVSNILTEKLQCKQHDRCIHSVVILQMPFHAKYIEGNFLSENLNNHRVWRQIWMMIKKNQ